MCEHHTHSALKTCMKIKRYYITFQLQYDYVHNLNEVLCKVTFSRMLTVRVHYQCVGVCSVGGVAVWTMVSYCLSRGEVLPKIDNVGILNL